ncbi:uncharacterized protein JCM15063_006001 [Sporobolomyces koalae]|uniref:uncharacterized protein n=1 Tax=Sporobolomyces koalae TaxID=500713 RepID=UPI003175C132
MSALTSKGPVQEFLKTTAGPSVHKDQVSQPQYSTPNEAFRQVNAATTTGEDEFGSFADHTPHRLLVQPLRSREEQATSSGNKIADHNVQEWRNHEQDGAEVQALLASGSGSGWGQNDDWEAELFERQQRNQQLDRSLPVDPLLPESSRSSGGSKGEQHLAGDLSPTSNELLSSLSSLDLSSLAYLRTLLSLPPEEAIQRYLATSDTYSDDVWGVPTKVREVFEQAQDRTQEDGREKAVRRLALLMQHLKLDATNGAGADFAPSQSSSTRAAEKGKGKALVSEQGGASAADLARQEWAREWAEYPLAAAHVRSPPQSHFEASSFLRVLRVPLRFDADSPRSTAFSLQQKALSPLSPRHEVPNISPMAHAPDPPPRVDPSPDVPQTISVPSSLSSEAFVVHSYSTMPGDRDRYPEGIYHEVPEKGTS